MADSLEDRRNLRMTAGDSKTIRTDTNVDLSGTTVRYAITDGRGGQELVSKTSGGSGIAITDDTGGVFEVYLDPVDTQDLLGGYWQEAEFEDADGDVTTVFTGRVTIAPNSV